MYITSEQLSLETEELRCRWQESISYCCKYLIRTNPEIKRIALSQGLNFIELYNGRKFDPEFSDDRRFKKLSDLLKAWYEYNQLEPGVYETRESI